MQILHSTITFILIFTTFYSYGSILSTSIYRNQKIDIFFKVLVGYTFVGLVTLIFHFFFKINNFFSIILIFIGLLMFVYKFSTFNKKNLFLLITSIIIFGFLLF